MDELSKAGITDPALRTSYLECKRLNSLHGKTYYLATLLLPPAKRPFVHALYGFARYADEIVDDLASTLTDEEKANSLKQWGEGVISDIKSGNSNDQIGKALVDTVRRFNIPIEYFQAFLHSMTMDLTITEYQEYEDLQEYVYGSAGVYLPIAELQSHGVTREMLEDKVLTPQIKSALKEQIERVRRLQRESAIGIKMLSIQSRACIQAASELYCGIVDEVEKIDYQIFSKRAKTSNMRRMKVAIPAYLRAVSSR